MRRHCRFSQIAWVDDVVTAAHGDLDRECLAVALSDQIGDNVRRLLTDVDVDRYESLQRVSSCM